MDLVEQSVEEYTGLTPCQNHGGLPASQTFIDNRNGLLMYVCKPCMVRASQLNIILTDVTESNLCENPIQ